MLKSILDIEVNDSSFRRYQEQFQKYQELLAKQPEAWERVTKNIDASRKSFDELVAAAAARQGYAKLTEESERTASRLAEGQARSWADMARSTKTVAGNILQATQALLRWASIGTFVTGLLGGGGLYGIDRLAVGVAAQRRSASGLGVNPGEESAFNIHYGRLINAPGMLEGINKAMTTVGGRGTLYQAGLTPQDIDGKDVTQIGATLVTRLKQLADSLPKGPAGDALFGSIIESRHIGENFAVTGKESRRIRDRPAGEIAEYERDTASASERWKIPEPVQKAWENLQVQLKAAATGIEVTFVKALANSKMPEALGKLSAAFEKLVTNVVGGPAGKSIIDGLTEGIGMLEHAISNGTFQRGVTDFVDGVVSLASAIRKALSYIPGFLKEIPKGVERVENLAKSGGATSEPLLYGPPTLEQSKVGQATDDGLGRTPPVLLERLNQTLEWFKDHLPNMGGAAAIPMGFTGGGPGTPGFGGMIHSAAFRGGAFNGTYGNDNNGGASDIPPGARTHGGGGGGSGSGSWSGAISNTAALDARAFWESKGLTPEQAAGMAAQEIAESGGNPGARGDGGAAMGLYQWHSDRRNRILAGSGIDVTKASVEQQREAAYWELTRGGEKNAWGLIKGSQTAVEAGRVATSYERPGLTPEIQEMERAKRGSLSERIWRLNGSGQASPETGRNGQMAMTVRIFNGTGANVSVSAASMGVG